MKRSKTLLLGAIVVSSLLFGGCVEVKTGGFGIKQQVALIKIAAKDAMYFGAERRMTKGQINSLVSLIKGDILPVLKGDETITKVVADEILKKLDGRCSLIVGDALIIVESFITEVPLDETIGKDNVSKIIALFEGILKGAQMVLEK